MWYCIYAKDSLDSLKKRQENRPEHLKRLKLLQDQGRLLLAGPFPYIEEGNSSSEGFSGSLIIAEFDTIKEAKQWADNDPFSIFGVYESFEVKPFKKTLP